jgi:hypothetical protein
MDNSDIIAVTSAIVALCAFGVSVFQTYATIRHNKLQVRPIISIESSSDSSDKFFAVHNLGLGPAIVNSITATFRSLDYDLLTQNGLDTLTDLVLGAKNGALDVFTICLQKDAAIAPGNCERIVVISKSTGTKHEAFVEDFIQNTIIRIDYKCIYDQPYKANNITT